MTKRIVSVTAALTLALVMLVGTVALTPAAQAAPKSTVTSLGGQDATALATLISQIRGSAGIYNVLVISGLNNAMLSTAGTSLRRGDVIVTIGPSLFPDPTIHKAEVTSNIEVDFSAKVATTTSVTSAQRSGNDTVSPIHLLSVAQKQGQTTHIADYGMLIESAQQYQNLLQSTAQDAADESMTPPAPTTTTNTHLASAGLTTVTPLLGGADGNWAKQYDRSSTYVLNSQGDSVWAHYEVYELNYWDVVSNTEYWRTDINVDHLMKSYTCGGSHCGPYINNRIVTVTAGSGEIIQYAPLTTNPDTTASVNIGVDVNTGGGGVHVDYQWSWVNPGVRYDVTADRPIYKTTWTESFNGPNYFWYPFAIYGPTNGAYNSFQAEPSIVMRTPVQSGFYLNSLDSQFETFNDNLRCGDFLCTYAIITRLTTDYHITYNPGRLNSMFAPAPTTITVNSCPKTDTYSRSHGLSWDQALPNPWWPPYQSGYEFHVSGSCINDPLSRSLARGSHYVQYAASGSLPSYSWHAKIYLNGVLIAEGDVGRANPLQANFNV